MAFVDAQAFFKKGLALLRLSGADWGAIEDTRNLGARFSINFPHEIARQGQRGGLVLISTPEPEPKLLLGLVTSISATSTLDSRVVFNWVRPIAPNSIAKLLELVETTTLQAPRNRLSAGEEKFVRVSPKLSEALISLIAERAENAPTLTRILAQLSRPTRNENARALQQDALALAIKAFGGSEEALSVALPGDDTAIATVRVLEDAAIEHDARWIPGWHLSDSDLTGRATFRKRGEQLEVFTANKRPLEALFGVDLIYLNVPRKALVMVQYKMLEELSTSRVETYNEEFDRDESEDERGEWIARIDRQFTEELERMRRFDCDLEPDGSYRLNSGAFFFKFVRRNAATKSAGLLMSLGHLEKLLSCDALVGPAGGLRVSYKGLNGHYLRGEGFIELVRSGYIGTRGATTDHLQTIIEQSLNGGKAVVAAIQSALEHVA